MMYYTSYNEVLTPSSNCVTLRPVGQDLSVGKYLQIGKKLLSL
jgi:hypothetical protein